MLSVQLQTADYADFRLAPLEGLSGANIELFAVGSSKLAQLGRSLVRPACSHILFDLILTVRCDGSQTLIPFGDAKESPTVSTAIRCAISILMWENGTMSSMIKQLHGSGEAVSENSTPASWRLAFEVTPTCVDVSANDCFDRLIPSDVELGISSSIRKTNWTCL